MRADDDGALWQVAVGCFRRRPLHGALNHLSVQALPGFRALGWVASS
jgi:hypothetical protein